MTLAAKVIADDTFHVFMLVAAILFVVATVMSLLERAWVTALLCGGLVCVALAYVVVS